ncbi:hypothetical protein ACQPYK_03640 [Streptosporangium sp. CA-135522]|uniref:hypothetical protein n=1 Tax=Streptosporangium sp. CA-135522 TaxID=3240072 RepID=UPI003D916769
MTCGPCPPGEEPGNFRQHEIAKFPGGKRDRDKYLQAMRRADNDEFGPLGELIARSVTTNLYRFVMPAVAGPVKLVPLPALATRDVTEDALRVAAARGRLRAVKGDDGMWRSSKKWVNEYLKSRHRRS